MKGILVETIFFFLILTHHTTYGLVLGNGCLRYSIDQNNNIKCVACSGSMILTSFGICSSC
jgi:hypothetical protein